jgi:DNA replication protein DnaC
VETLRNEEPQSKQESPVITDSEKPTLRTEWQQKWLRLSPHHPKMQKLADEAQAFAKAFFQQDRVAPMIVITGQPGCGKTHIARNLYRWARRHSHAAYDKHFWPKPPAVMFSKWPAVADGFKEGSYGILEDLFSADMLVIDDIGAEHDPSKNAGEKLCQILSNREIKFTVITSNIAPNEWEERFGSRTADRLMRRSKIIDLFDVPSFATV